MASLGLSVMGWKVCVPRQLFSQVAKGLVLRLNTAQALSSPSLNGVLLMSVGPSRAHCHVPMMGFDRRSVYPGNFTPEYNHAGAWMVVNVTVVAKPSVHGIRQTLDVEAFSLLILFEIIVTGSLWAGELTWTGVYPRGGTRYLVCTGYTFSTGTRLQSSSRALKPFLTGPLGDRGDMPLMVPRC